MLAVDGRRKKTAAALLLRATARRCLKQGHARVLIKHDASTRDDQDVRRIRKPMLVIAGRVRMKPDQLSAEKFDYRIISIFIRESGI